jgi:CubicO group peptidase (beta-lactamase class C family)
MQVPSKQKMRQLPLVPLRAGVVYPGMNQRLAIPGIVRVKSVRALEKALAEDSMILLCCQSDKDIIDPSTVDIYRVGTIAKVRKRQILPNGIHHVEVKGIMRAEVVEYLTDDTYFEVNVREMPEEESTDPEINALMRTVLSQFEHYINLSKKIKTWELDAISVIDKPGRLADEISRCLSLEIKDKQEILETFDVKERLEMLLPILNNELATHMKTVAGKSKDLASRETITNSDSTSNVATPWEQEADRFLRQNTFNGTVLIAREGEILFCQGYGKANASKACSPETVYRIASISKQFTAAAILQLEERGLLHVNDTIDKYIPDFKNGERITIHHLLSHTSGIPREFPRIPNATLAETIDQISSYNLDFEPGTEASYSNSGYIMLAYLIQTVSMESYSEYMSNHILKPLNMTSTGEYLHSDDRVAENLATGYTNGKEGLVEAPFQVTQSGCGSLYSTVCDLLLWDRALYSERILKKSSIEKMYKPNLGSYGYGWRTYPRRPSVVEHGGGGSGISTFITGRRIRRRSLSY